MDNITIFLITNFVAISTYACAVCGFGEDGSRAGYLITTGIMTFTPLIVLGVIFYIVRKKVENSEKLSVDINTNNSQKKSLDNDPNRI